MEFRPVTAKEVILLHDSILNDGDLQGMAGDKSLEGALGRIESRLQYGMMHDVYDLAAVYAIAISQVHVFNDANKRTAHATMKLVLKLHQVSIKQNYTEIGDIIIQVAQGKMDEVELARWLRQRAM